MFSKVSVGGIYLILIQHALSAWIDPDTPTERHVTKALTLSDTREYNIVFSDEFETPNRSFDDGEDPKWTSIDKNDYTNNALHYYRSVNARTNKGNLQITTDLHDTPYKAYNEKTKKYYVDTKHVQSAMLQTWNKFCYTGGIIEISAKLPGQSSIGGLWPALWLLGNLARATYVGSSDWVWPFSYDKCDPTTRYSQEIDACRKVSHYGMRPGVGRGAPEIDILEAMGGEIGPLPNTPIQRPYFSSSLQVAPGLTKDRPVLMQQPKPGHWYENLEYGNSTYLNPFFYGVTLIHKPKDYTYQSDAISANTHISQHYYDYQHVYRVEWEPPVNETGGYVRWYLDGNFIFGINGESLNLTGSSIPSEPMYIILNTAVASSWGFPVPCPDGCDCECFDCKNSDCQCGLPSGYCDNFPAVMDIDYVRVWQAVGDSGHQIGCSTESRPTELFIKAHRKRYKREEDSEPLQPLRVGGRKCTSAADCGGPERGSCSAGRCKCLPGFVSSNCLAYDGFDDVSFESVDNNLPVYMITMPRSLVVIFSLFSSVLCVTIYVIVFKRKREERDMLRRIEQARENAFLRAFHNGDDFGPSYQWPRGGHSNIIIPRDNAKSYYLIDNRLIDE